MLPPASLDLQGVFHFTLWKNLWIVWITYVDPIILSFVFYSLCQLLFCRSVSNLHMFFPLLTGLCNCAIVSAPKTNSQAVLLC